MKYAASRFEIKELSDSGQIEGLLAGFGDVDRSGDRLLKGCFVKTLAARRDPLPMLLYHDMKKPIGAWKGWQERPAGLYVEGVMTLATRDAQEAYALAKDGALTGLSIGYLPTRETTDQRSGIRTIMEADLFEGSLVPVPMHDRARVTAVKSITSARDIAELLQDGGLSGRRAKAAAGAAWKAINQSEDEAAADAELAALLTASTARLIRDGVR